MKKTSKLALVIYRLLAAIAVALHIMLIYLANLFNILNIGKYRLIIIGYFVVLLLALLLITLKRLRPSIRKVTTIITTLSIVLSAFAVFFFGRFYISLNRFTTKEFDRYRYYVITARESELTDVDSLNDQKIAYYHQNGYDTDVLALNQLGNLVDFEYETVKKTSEVETALTGANYDAVLISDFGYNLLKDNDKDIESKIKIIYQFDIEDQTADIAKRVDVSKESFNIYISGDDNYGDINTVGRSDVNMIVTVNPKTREILITTMPRDSYIILTDIPYGYDKITHASNYGMPMSISILEDLLEIDINYYARINFTTLVSLVDDIAGIEVYNDYTFETSSEPQYLFPEGAIKLDGQQALGFSRERYNLPENLGDFGRGQNQVKVIQGIIKKMMTTPILLTNIDQVLNTVEGSFTTNMHINEITTLLNYELRQSDHNWTIRSIQIQGTPSTEYCYSTANDGPSSVVILDQASVDEVIAEINAVYYGTGK